MPVCTRTGAYHVPPGFEQGGFFAESVNLGGSSHTVYTFVSDPKADKHNLGAYWPQQQGGLHTAITVDDDQFQPLYKMFGRDLAAECRNRGNGNIWIELRYGANELPGQYYSGNVGNRRFAQVQSLTAGGSITYRVGTGYIVFVNHGPY